MSTWMNEWEVEEAVERFARTADETPNLNRGARILSRLMEWTNRNSDGWPYWKLPANAAGKLMDLLHEAMRSYAIKDASEADLKRVLSPIKAFLTKRGVDHALILEEPTPPPPPVEGRRLEVTQMGPDQVTIQFDGLEIQLWRSSLKPDAGQPVVQIDGTGMFRVNVNDYPIWNADPDNHQHRECVCVTEFESRDEEG